jgi:hypothetical protein
VAAGNIYYQNFALHLNFVTNLMLFDLFWGVEDVNSNIALANQISQSITISAYSALIGGTTFNTAISAWASYFGANILPAYLPNAMVAGSGGGVSGSIFYTMNTIHINFVTGACSCDVSYGVQDTNGNVDGNIQLNVPWPLSAFETAIGTSAYNALGSAYTSYVTTNIIDVYIPGALQYP